MTRLMAAAVVVWMAAPGGVPAAAQQQAVPCPPALPANLIVDGILQPLVAGMLAQSPRFREQCRRIAETRYARVFVQPVIGRVAMTGRARASIRRFSQGALIAVVSLPMPIRRDDAVELVAHEVEHVLEQIERVDLAGLAAAGGGATRLADGAFETERARRAGRAVAAETLDGVRPGTAGSAQALTEGVPAAQPATQPPPSDNSVRPSRRPSNAEGSVRHRPIDVGAHTRWGLRRP